MKMVVSALVWVTLSGYLLLHVPPSEFGLTVWAIFTAEIISKLLTSGLLDWLRRHSNDCQAHLSYVLTALVVRSAWFAAFMVLLAWPTVGKLGAIDASILAILSGLAVTRAMDQVLATYLAGTANEKSVTPPNSVAYPSLSFGLILIASSYWTLSGFAVSGVFLCVALVILSFRCAKLRNLRFKRHQQPSVRQVLPQSIEQVGASLCKSLDLFVAPLFFEHTALSVYMAARLFASSLQWMLDQFGATFSQHLEGVWRSRSRQEFVAIAARVNLGMLLIGGAAAVLVTAAASVSLQVVGGGYNHALEIAVWLLVGQSAPTIFGNANMMMQICGMNSIRSSVVWFWLPFGIVGCVFASFQGPWHLAIAWTILQFAVATICAIALAQRHGVWPGITAILHGSIRLR